jgi:hypothetical protein
VNSLTDSELKALLEALHIALRVTVVFPPLEHSRIYTQIDDLWAKFGTEAIARGLTRYAEYYPEMEGVHGGDALDTGSDAEEAIDFHDDDRFWHALSARVAYAAAKEVHGAQFDQLPREEQNEIHSKFSARADELFRERGIDSILNLDAITKA